MICRSACCPTLPVENWMTLCVKVTPSVASHEVGDGLQAGVVENSGQHASVDLDGGSVDVVGLAAAEIHPRAPPLGGAPRPPQWHLREVRGAVPIVGGQDEVLEVVRHR